MNQSKHKNKKKVEQEKLFYCGCTKIYKSYAALYTHVKFKHEGIFPEGSSKKD